MFSLKSDHKRKKAFHLQDPPKRGKRERNEREHCNDLLPLSDVVDESEPHDNAESVDTLQHEVPQDEGGHADRGALDGDRESPVSRKADGDGRGASPENEPEERELSADGTELRFREFYEKAGYCSRNRETEQYYAKDEKRNDIYYKNSSNEDIYAWKVLAGEDGSMQKIEYPATREGLPVYTYRQDGSPRLPVNLDTNVLQFPVNPVTHEQMYLPDLRGYTSYPTNKYGLEFYRKDRENNDVPLNPYQYIRDANSTQYYPKKANGDEFYLRHRDESNREVAALRRVSDNLREAYYARKANGDLIYPRVYLEDK